ncbi:50S ribosomal protein L15 [bacterium]|nr:50S ribosomal protein L15 [bacterium]MBU0899792.1 50S ribosomal protein L15 [bacterium]MBU1153612.1 50S ribosomal protein L15 [bacterium]MBU1782609.1 50S ribosomal protein L15 [bacterium]MBU2600249.1 50S ribosomal protein L15 [bacterium]
MNLAQLYPAIGSTKKRKRVGRGTGSGHGGTSTRGNKGQRARSGGKSQPYQGFEGGQMPLMRRTPKKGFTNIFKEKYSLVNIIHLNKFKANTKIDKELLLANKVIKGKKFPVKLLSEGEINFPVTIVVDKISKKAREKIEKAGGKVEINA